MSLKKKHRGIFVMISSDRCRSVERYLRGTENLPIKFYMKTKLNQNNCCLITLFSVNVKVIFHKIFRNVKLPLVHW